MRPFEPAIFFSAAALALVAELPCVCRATALVGKSGSPLSVFLGTLLGTALILAPFLYGAGELHRVLPEGILRVAAALIFGGTALLILFGRH